MDHIYKKRVTCKRNYPVNDLLMQFLNEFKETERKKNGDSSRMLFTFGNALKSLKLFPIEIKEVDDLKNLRFFGDVIIAKLTKKLAEFRKEHGEPTKKLLKELKKTKLGTADPSDMPKCEKGSRKKDYVPVKGSGSYAILRALYDDSIFNGGIENGGVYLEDLRKAADPYAREAVVKSSALQHYTPFSCIRTLTDKLLIKRKKVGRKDVVSLTEEGFKLAEQLHNNDDNEASTDGEQSMSGSKNVLKLNHGRCSDKTLVRKRTEATSTSNGENKKRKSNEPNRNENVDFDLKGDSDQDALLKSDEDDDYRSLLPLANRLASKSVGLQTKTSNSFNDFDDQPGPSWKGFKASSTIETDLVSLKSSESFDGYVFITLELSETLLKSEACREFNSNLGIDIVWTKACETFLTSQGFLYEHSPNEGIFEKPFILVYLSEVDANDIAPGLVKKVTFEAKDEQQIESQPSKNLALKSKQKPHFVRECSALNSPSDNVSDLPNQIKKFCDVQIITEDIVLEPFSFDIILIADFAEVKGGVPMTGEKNSNRRDLLSDYFEQRGVKFESRKLNVGDYLWVARKRHCDNSAELVLDLIIERKRIDDLAKSITDGRWDSQKYRLKRCGLRKVMYLFEDLPKSMKQPAFNPAALRSAMINAEIQDGFSVEKTLHTKDTADFISRMTKFLIRNFKGKRLTCRKFGACDEVPESDGVLDLESNSVPLLPFDEFQKLALKPRRFTIGDSFIMCLMQISGVSIELAKGIGTKFSTFRGLMNAYDECGDDERAKIKLLEDIKSGAQGRRLGPSLAKKIADFFCSKIENE